MNPGPSKALEWMVTIFVPPACREEVLGDLHERFASPAQYLGDALHAVPLVIMSRIRRIADPQILVIQGFAFYASFLAAACLRDYAMLGQNWALVRLACPAALAVAGLLLSDVYTHPGSPSALHSIRGPLLGIVLATAAQQLLRVSDPGLTVPPWIMFYGCVMSLISSSAVRLLFPPLATSNGPAIGSTGGERSSRRTQRITVLLKWIAAALALTVAGAWLTEYAEYSVPPRAVVLLLMVIVAYQLGRRR